MPITSSGPQSTGWTGGGLPTGGSVNPFSTTTGSVGTGLAALGALGSLGVFGGGGPVVNPYATEADSNYTGANNAATQMSTGGNALETTGQNDLAQYGGAQNTANGAFGNELAYLNSDPYTNTVNEAQLNGATAGTMNNYRGAGTAALAALGNRLGPGAGTSSAASGITAGVDASEAGALSGAQNNIAMSDIAQRGRNLAEANQIAAQHASSLFGMGMSGITGGGDQLYHAGDLYDTTGNNWINQGQQQIQDTQNAQNASSNSWAGLAGVGASFIPGL